MTREELGFFPSRENNGIIDGDEKASQDRQTELGVEYVAAEPANPLADKDFPPLSSSEQRLPPYWFVPYERNPYFTDRNDLLENLSRDLMEGTSPFPIYAVSGIPGVGKTQVATEYAYQFMSRYQAVFWLRADTTENLQADLIDAAYLLGLPETADSSNQKAILHAVIQWFSHNEQWLLIADNVERIEDITNLFLFQDRGHIILTTRLAAVGKPVIIKEISPLELEDSTTLLLRRADLISENNDMRTVAPQDLEPAKAFSVEVDGLPLVLDQAGAYIYELECSLTEYLDLYQTQRRALLERRGERTFGHPDSAVATIVLALRRIQASTPAAVELLYFYAFLYSENIPETLVRKGSLHQGSLLQNLSTNPSLLKEAHGLLSRYALIRHKPATSSPTLYMHRLVQNVLRDLLEPEERRMYAELAVHVVSHAVTELSFAQWDQYRNYIDQARACMKLIDEWNIHTQEAAKLLSWIAMYLHEQDAYGEAESLIQQSQDMLAQIGEKQGKPALDNINHLATLYLDQGKLTEAEQLYRQVLLLLEQDQYEPDQLSHATIQNNLGELYTAQARYHEAEEYLRQALSIRQQILGATHVLVATSYYCLAEACSLQEKYTEAGGYLQKALDIRQQQFSSDHPSIAESLNGLGANSLRQKRYEEAESFFLQALSIREKVFGSDHSSIAQIEFNLGNCYMGQRRIQEAKQSFQRALQLNRQQLGEMHSDVADCLGNLALITFMDNSLEEARSFLDQALRIRLRVSGSNHPATVKLLELHTMLHS